MNGEKHKAQAYKASKKSSSRGENYSYYSCVKQSKHLTENPDHKIDFDKTEIMAQTNHWGKLLITETLLIQKHNPNLNVDRTSIPLYLFNT